jgi:hypothetical protein
MRDLSRSTDYLRFPLIGVLPATDNLPSRPATIPRQEQCSATRRRFVLGVNMSAIAFTSQEDELFVESVRKYPELYDCSHVQYFNLLIKDAKWKEISQNIFEQMSIYQEFKISFRIVV